MGKVGFVLNGVLLTGVMTVLFLGSEGVAAPVVEGEEGGGLGSSRPRSRTIRSPTTSQSWPLVTWITVSPVWRRGRSISTPPRATRS